MVKAQKKLKKKREENDDQGLFGLKTKKSGGFQSMGLSWQILKGTLNNGYKQPTPIQRKTIPEILLGKDMVAMARTGSGKTAAFLIPMFQRLQTNKASQAGPRALIMSPTRELALQTFRFCKLLGKYCEFKAAVILGGDKMQSQFETMHENPDIVIATPGRFLHICIEMNLKLSTIEYVVFDEADRLFEMGFKEQLNEILHKLPVESRQTLLFSATLPQSLVEFAKAGLQNPTLIRLDVETKLSENLKLAYFHSREEDKLALLMYLLNFIIKPEKQPSDSEANENRKLSQTVIFVATKHHVEFLKDLLECFGYSVSYAYSSLDQTARKINIAKFHNKKTSLLIVTDVAARGIDIPMLDNVINFNFPSKPKLFVHRVGRVARAGQSGTAYSILSNDEIPYLFELNEFLGKSIKLAHENDNNEWNEVYGSVPQAIIDIEKENIENLINSKIDLSSAFTTQTNAFKQYLKSRQAPCSNAIKMAKKFRLSHPNLPVQPLLKIEDIKSELETVDSSFLDQLKNFKTKTTIFEINKTQANQKSAEIMRTKRVRDERQVQKFQTNFKRQEGPLTIFEENMYRIRVETLRSDNKQESNDDDNENVEIKTFDEENLEIKIRDDDESKKRGKKRKSYIDIDHFIPYKQKNYETEKALGVHNSFDKQASQAAFDMAGDDEDLIRRSMQKSKWDRKKKKFVNVGGQEREKKFKTESGAYISKSFKTSLYSKWLKNSKKGEASEENNDGDESTLRKSQKFFGPEKRFFGNHKFKATGRPGVKRFKKQNDSENKRPRKRYDGKSERSQNAQQSTKRPFKTGLKTQDQILKGRKIMAKTKSMQQKRGKGKSGGGGNAKRGGGRKR